MNPLKNIEKSIKKLILPGSEGKDEQILNDTLAAFEQALRKKTGKVQFNIWRILLKNRITKIAVAAIIIFGIILSVNILDKTVPPAFGMDHVLSAIAKTKWMHTTWEYIGINTASKTLEQEIRETWTSVDPRINITIYRNGSVNLSQFSLDEAKYQKYNPESNVLITRYRPSGNDYQYESIIDIILQEIAEAEKTGAEVEYVDGVFNNSPVRIINIDAIDDSGIRQKASIIIDIRTHLPKHMTHIQEDSGRSITANVMFDYPESGPTDIYQVGVPYDAENKVIGQRLTPEFLEAIKPYRAARSSLPEQRIVIEVANENNNRSLVSVIYTNGIKERFDQIKYVRNNTLPNTGDFEAILDWTKTLQSNELEIQLNDGTYVHRVNRDHFGRWTGRKESITGYKIGLRPAGLVYNGWPGIDVGEFIENDYSVKNKLLCIETRRTPRFTPDGRLAEAAERKLYYIDPEHDYICVRVEGFKYPVPPAWGNHKINELDIDPNEIPSEPYLVTDVVEFGRTHTDHWYPARIIKTDDQSWIDYGRGWEMRKKTFDIRLYVDVSPEFPKGIFNHEELPK
jgi:hypothetical protein